MSPYPSQSPPVLRVRAEVGDGQKTFSFTRPFRVGRTDDCEVCIKNEHVSRKHVEVVFEGGTWLVRDLNSANGIFVNGEKVPSTRVSGVSTVRLGIYGPFVEFAVEQPAAAVPPIQPIQPVRPRVEPLLEPEFQPLIEPVVDLKPVSVVNTPPRKDASHYFGDPRDQSIGDHTRMVRLEFAKVQTKQKRKYGGIIALLVVCALGAGGYAYYLHQQTQKNRAMAQALFYSMKSIDVGIADVEKRVDANGSPEDKAKVRDSQLQRKSLEDNYNRYLATLKVYDPKMTQQERLVLRVARIFGECELAMPQGFLAEVQNYISQWQSSGRFLRAVRLAQEKGYTETIARELLAKDLPPQFFYLAMQESDFDATVSGSVTRSGIAKGMWQFIPATAVQYGLHLGPLVDLRRPDPGDDRHHWDRETKAAAAYMKDLYSSDAQASGLLVMACYNWGEGSVLPLVRKMPANPRERNFWKLLELYRDKIPDETYKYVFSIVSAAVIGEDPRLFRIDCDNPLGGLESK